MSARASWIPGVIFLFCALVLSLLVSISLPSLPTLDIARVHFDATSVRADELGQQNSVGQLRVSSFPTLILLVMGTNSSAAAVRHLVSTLACSMVRGSTNPLF